MEFSSVAGQTGFYRVCVECLRFHRLPVSILIPAIKTLLIHCRLNELTPL